MVKLDWLISTAGQDLSDSCRNKDFSSGLPFILLYNIWKSRVILSTELCDVEFDLV